MSEKSNTNSGHLETKRPWVLGREQKVRTYVEQTSTICACTYLEFALVGSCCSRRDALEVEERLAELGHRGGSGQALLAAVDGSRGEVARQLEEGEGAVVAAAHEEAHPARDCGATHRRGSRGAAAARQPEVEQRPLSGRVEPPEPHLARRASDRDEAARRVELVAQEPTAEAPSRSRRAAAEGGRGWRRTNQTLVSGTSCRRTTSTGTRRRQSSLHTRKDGK